MFSVILCTVMAAALTAGVLSYGPGPFAAVKAQAKTDAGTAPETAAEQPTGTLEMQAGEAADETAAEPDEAMSAEAAGDDYASLIFDNSYVHSIDIAIADEDWQDLLAHPTDKTKYRVSVTIDGEVVDNVSFATKGNSSLVFVAASEDFDRYSYKLNFSKFDKEQTWHGLDKLNLHNMFADASYMHDSLSYSMFDKMGVPAPLTSYVWLTVNGEDRGLYNAVEEIDEGFLDRTAAGDINLYKPDVEELAPEEGAALAGGEAESASIGKDPAGTDLVYTDDLPEHYSGIFVNNVNKDNDEVQAAVIGALKGLSEWTAAKAEPAVTGDAAAPEATGDVTEPAAAPADLEEYLDTDEIIRYFAVHNFLLNFDSYTGVMLHNYYLGIKDGKLSMLPWDYNSVFGAFPADGVMSRGNDVSVVVNQGIDSPLSGTTVRPEERPMWNWIQSDAGYREQYHAAMDELISGCIDSGELAAEAAVLYDMLLPYVEKDPTSFYTLEEFNRGYEMLLAFLQRRAESIRRQLDGELASVTEDQAEEDRVDTSGLNTNDLGPKDKLIPAAAPKEQPASEQPASDQSDKEQP